MENKYQKIGNVTYTIAKIISEKPVEGVNKKTGEVWSYVQVELKENTTGKPSVQNVFISKFNPIEKIVVGATITESITLDTETGKQNFALFIGSERLTVAEKLRIAGADETTIKNGVAQVRANILASRAARLEAMASATNAM